MQAMDMATTDFRPKVILVMWVLYFTVCESAGNCSIGDNKR